MKRSIHCLLRTAAPLLALTLVPALQATPAAAQDAATATASAPVRTIRFNQLGYLPAAPKIAVLCTLDGTLPRSFEVHDASGQRVHGPVNLRADGAMGGCTATARMDFSGVRTEGTYTLVAGDAPSVQVRIAADTYRGAADTLLYYMRQQRSLFNPLFRDSVHHRTDGILVDHPRAGEFIDVAGGWADAADYLQYVTTSAHATFAMLAAHRDHPRVFGDRFDAAGLPGANGIPDVLDEARHGLNWLVKMHPSPDMILNQLADDRDHSYLDLPPSDSSNYGWGHGSFRPVYPCTGKPQGLFQHRNDAEGKASTAGKMAAAFALGARTFEKIDAAFARQLREKAFTAYQAGRDFPGACPTAPGRAPYFYEEANWVDDMELAAAELYALTREQRYLEQALEYADQEPVTPWMGRDTARHYEFYPWYNPGHFSIWQHGDRAAQQRMIDYYRRGIEAVTARATNGFRIGIPFIWCSNNLLASWATQAALYARMSGSGDYGEHLHAAVDWLLGTNPWGTSMIIGFPAGGDVPVDPHSVVYRELGVHTQLGGLVDGPVYRSIYENLMWIRLHEPDEYAPWNTGHVVYHDDWGDYSTNEPIMDGTAVLLYLFAIMGDM